MVYENLFSYIVPVTLPPWNIPRELPVYQFTVAILCKVFNFDIDTCSRCVSISFFYLSTFLLYRVSKLIFSSLITSRLTVIIFLFSPTYLFWSRTCMIESCALFFSLGFLYYALSFVKKERLSMFGLLLFGIVAALVKITTFYPVVVFLFSYTLIYKKEVIINKKILFIMSVIFLSVFFWYLYCKEVREFDFLFNNSGQEGFSWIFGFTEKLIDLQFYKILWWEISSLVFPNFLFLLPLLVIGKNNFLYYTTIFAFFIASFTFANLYLHHDYYIYGSGFLIILLVSFSICKIIKTYFSVKSFYSIYIILFVFLILNYTYLEKDYFRIQFKEHEDFSNFKNKIDRHVGPLEVGLICGEFCNPTLGYHLRRKCATVGDYRNFPDAFPEILERIKDHCIKYGEPIKFVLLPKSGGYEKLRNSVSETFGMKKNVVLENYILFTN